MSYIGNEPSSTAFLTDTFSGNGSTTAFTMSAAPATSSAVLVSITGVLQDPATYGVVGTTLTFSAAPPSGTGNISVRYLGIPASGVTTSAYRTITEFTATAGQTTFTPPSYTPGFISVFRNGALLSTTDYTATNGTTVVLGSAAAAGDLVTIESFYVSSVLNALPQTGGTLSGSLVVNGATGQNPLIVQTNTIEAMRVNNSGNVGIGTSSPNAKVDSNQATGFSYAATRTSTSGYSGLSFYENTTNTSYIVEFGSAAGGGQRLQMWTNTAFPIAFGTNNTERMRIDSNGRVTTPFQPAFQVYGATSPVSNGNKVAWPSSKFNRGNHFDNTNSRFTAPVTGIYWMSVIFHLTTTNSPARPSFRVNGSDYSVGGDAAQTVTNVTGAEITSILQIHMTLTAGDYVEVFARTGGGSLNFYTGHTWWSGNLIG